MTDFTPFTGYNGRPRWVRGCLAEGKVHAVAGSYDHTRGPGGVLLKDKPVTAACGRRIEHLAGVFDSKSWPGMWVQPHETHVTGVCRDCVRKAVPADDDVKRAWESNQTLNKVAEPAPHTVLYHRRRLPIPAPPLVLSEET